MANITTNFYPVQGQNWKTKLMPFKASTAIDMGAAVAWEISSNDVTGYLTTMGVENAAGADFVGILMETIASTDDDYATAGKLKMVAVPMNRDQAEAYFTVGAGTFTATDVGRTVEIHTGAKSLAVDTAGKGARITGYISSTRGKCTFPMPNTETA